MWRPHMEEVTVNFLKNAFEALVGWMPTGTVVTDSPSAGLLELFVGLVSWLAALEQG